MKIQIHLLLFHSSSPSFSSGSILLRILLKWDRLPSSIILSSISTFINFKPYFSNPYPELHIKLRFNNKLPFKNKIKFQNLNELPKVVDSSKKWAKFIVFVNSLVAQANSATSHSSNPSLDLCPNSRIRTVMHTWMFVRQRELEWVIHSDY